MKLLIVLLAISAYVTAEEIEIRGGLGRSISGQAIDALEKLRQQMPCGFPEYGIPPLAPLKIQHKELDFKTDALSVDGEVHEARIDGLDKFEILDLKVNVIFSKVTFKLNFPKISAKSLYVLESFAKAYGFTIELQGKGDFSMEFKNLEISGTVKYSIFNGIMLKSCKIIATLEDVDSNIEGILGVGFGNRKMNELLEELILLGVNDNQDLITNTIEDFAIQKTNEALEGYTLADIIASIGGGSGESQKCVPPEDN